MSPVNRHPLIVLGLIAALVAGLTEGAPQTGNHGAANAHMGAMDFATLVSRFEASDRAGWQRPDAVIANLGDIQGKTVEDLGAGTGYFSLRLAAAGAKVIAADVDRRFLDFIEARLIKHPPGFDKVVTRLLTYDAPGLEPGEADRVLMVDVYHHLEGRKDYLPKLRKGLKSDGVLAIVDFKKAPTPEGPPVAMRLEPETIKQELAAAGFQAIEIDNTLLPYQYVIKARP